MPFTSLSSGAREAPRPPWTSERPHLTPVDAQDRLVARRHQRRFLHQGLLALALALPGLAVEWLVLLSVLSLVTSLALALGYQALNPLYRDLFDPPARLAILAATLLATTASLLAILNLVLA